MKTETRKSGTGTRRGTTTPKGKTPKTRTNKGTVKKTVPKKVKRVVKDPIFKTITEAKKQAIETVFNRLKNANKSSLVKKGNEVKLVKFLIGLKSGDLTKSEVDYGKSLIKSLLTFQADLVIKHAKSSKKEIQSGNAVSSVDIKVSGSLMSENGLQLQYITKLTKGKLGFKDVNDLIAKKPAKMFEL